MKKYLKEFDKLVGILKTLRSKDGCMWDRKQTYGSLVKHLLSEAQEVKQAVENKDMDNLEEELGDMLLQIVFYAQIGRENKDFNIDGIIKRLNKKLIRRHPHVFSNYKVKNIQDIEVMWERIKKVEKGKTLKNNIKKQFER
jgi:tetrapyrrole methylase family protein/MazG family protein